MNAATTRGVSSGATVSHGAATGVADPQASAAARKAAGVNVRNGVLRNRTPSGLPLLKPPYPSRPRGRLNRRPGEAHRDRNLSAASDAAGVAVAVAADEGGAGNTLQVRADRAAA